MTPTEALQLISNALEPQAQGQISRAGYIAIQRALEALAEVINPKPEPSDEPND